MTVKHLLNLTSDTLRTLPMLILYLTDGCNSRCVTCDIWRNPRRNMRMERVEALAAQIRPLGVRWVVLSGGEAMQHPAWAAIARKLRAEGARVILLTNGLFLKKQADDVIASVDEVVVSLDGGTAATYAAIRGVDAFDLVLYGIRAVRAGGIDVTTRTVVQRANYRELPAIIDGKNDAGKPLKLDPTADKEAQREARCRTLAVPGEIFTQFSVLKEGKFTIKIRAGAEQAGNEPARLAVKIDGQVVGELKVTAKAKSPGQLTCSATLPPGAKRLSLIFLNPFTDPPPEVKPVDPKAPKPVAGKPKDPPAPRTRSVTIEEIEVTGPPGERVTDLHKRLFVAVPGKDLSARDAATKIAEQFAARAFRRPANKEQLDLLMKVFDLADSQGETFSESVKLMVKAALISPEFYFRIEEDRKSDADGVYRLDAWELASRLSYFLWSSMPDDELFATAKDGSLLDPKVQEFQVRRMIANPKTRALVDNFGGQWLRLRTIFEVTPDEKKYPEMTSDLRQAMYEEGALVFDAILREGRSIVDFIDTDFTFLNERLAKHYGISGVSGPAMRKVTLTDRNRGGIITMGSVLTVTSNPTRTSPVKRGKWVMEEILGTPPPPPPPMVEALDKEGDTATASMTLRQRMERHRQDPTCASCHVVMDAIGFGLENFDAIGRWRDKDADAGVLVDTSGELPGNQKFSSPSQLKQLFLTRRDDFCRTLAEKMLVYALGRKTGFNDQDAIDAITTATIKDGYRLDRLVVTIAQSYPFQYRRLAR